MTWYCTSTTEQKMGVLTALYIRLCLLYLVLVAVETDAHTLHCMRKEWPFAKCWSKATSCQFFDSRGADDTGLGLVERAEGRRGQRSVEVLYDKDCWWDVALLNIFKVFAVNRSRKRYLLLSMNEIFNQHMFLIKCICRRQYQKSGITGNA